MSDFIPPRNLPLGACSTCQSCQCEIPADKLLELINAVKDKFGDLPVDEAATMFVAEWVARHYPQGVPALLNMAFMSRYMDFALDVLCGNREI